jgi:hypothetical protein
MLAGVYDFGGPTGKILNGTMQRGYFHEIGACPDNLNYFHVGIFVRIIRDKDRENAGLYRRDTTCLLVYYKVPTNYLIIKKIKMP